MSEPFYDVIVVGCGPVGAAAANFLGHRGLRTLVIERDTEPYTLPRAIHFDHEIMRLFQSAGMADAIAPHLHTPAGAMFFGMKRQPIGQFRPNVRSPRLGWPSANYFYQPDLERVMRDALLSRASVTTAFGHVLDLIAADADGVAVRATASNGTLEARGKYVIACDGGRSTVRKHLGIELDDLDFEEPWIVVDAFVDGPLTLPELHGTPDGVDMQEVLFIIGDPQRPTSVIPGVGRHRRWEFMLLPGERSQDYEDGSKVREMLAPFVGDVSYEVIRTAVYRFHALIAREWQRGRVFLAGDSAHQTPPFYGQGLCHGIRDVANLAWKLERVIGGSASEALLTTYQPERETQVRAVVEAAVRAGRYLCTLDPQLAAKRDAELEGRAAAPAESYVDLIPCLDRGLLAASKAPPTGARFIQPPVQSSDGQTRLLDDATGGDFVMLVRSPADLSIERDASLPIFEIAGADSEAGEHRLRDVSGELGKWFDHHRCSGVILRPDFYVFGTFASAMERRALIEELRKALGPR